VLTGSAGLLPSTAMRLRHAPDESEMAGRVAAALEDGATLLGTDAMGDALAREIARLPH